MTKRRSPRNWMGIIFGIPLLIAGLGLGIWSLYCVMTYERAVGRARYLGIAETSPGKHRGGSKFQIGFHSTDGRPHSFEVTTAGWLGLRYEEGEAVPVLYAATDPESSRRSTFVTLWLLPLLMTGCGAFFLWTSSSSLYSEESEDANLSAEELIARGSRPKR